jgi:DNA-binding transcriptional regulator YiaG
MFYIYRHTNTITGKSYIGYTGKTIEERFGEHIIESIKFQNTNRPFHMALLKYPLECWISDCLATAENKSEAGELEKFYIAEHKTHYSFGGYNATHGGDGFVGGRHSPRSKLQTSLKLRGRKLTRINNKEGKPLSQEHYNKLKQKRTKYKKITESDFNFIKENMEVMSFAELARILKTDGATIRKWANRDNYSRAIRKSEHLRSISKEQYDYIQLHKDNKSLREISIDISLNYDLVKKWSKITW